MKKLAQSLSLSALILAGTAAPAAADVFPAVSEKERALTSVAGEPNAAAVVLFKKAEFLMWGYDQHGAASSRLLVQERKKILTEQGKELAEIAIAHSDQVRLASFKGRTVLPDGRVLPLQEDARFERKESKRHKYKVTSVAFPGVEVGAILDYQYELRFDSIYFLEPWYFSDELPVVYSEIVFKIPGEYRAQGWDRDPFGLGIKRETKKSSRGSELRVWLENIPSVPDDPFGLPFSDLAAQMMMIPTAYQDEYVVEPLLESWASVCKLYEQFYAKARRKDGAAVKKAKEIAAAGGPTARDKAVALYRFVRDEIDTIDAEGIGLAEGSSVDKTLSAKRGDYAEKALLLQSMLNALKLNARLVWAGDRWNGQIDPAIANPQWFDTVLVALELDGQRTYLDPSDRALAFGRLRYPYEGTPALIHDAKKPEGVVLPETPYDQSARRAVVDLDVGADGRLTGKGEVTFTGHHAWEKIDWKEDEAATLEAWKEWLGDDYKGFEIEDVQFQELPDEQKARITWSLKQREEEVLGDETSLVPSVPLGPVRQPFVQDGSKRRSPVLFLFADRDEVEMRLRWPEGWKLETRPRAVNTKNRAGAVSVQVEVDEAGRSLVYRRRMDVTQKLLPSQQQYEEVRALFGAVEKSDAESLALARR